MSLGLRERKSRRRRQVRMRVLKWGGALAAVVLAGVYAYETGNRLAEREVTRLQEQIADLTARIEQLDQDNMQLAEAARSAKGKVEVWQQRYRQDIPTGELKTLYELTREKLAGGVDSTRLAFILQQASQANDCSDEIETKRFYVKTPLYNGGNDTVGFADSAIVVTAQGSAKVDGSGNQLVRFDPAQPVVVRFARLGGDASEASGLLPLHQTMVIGDTEYRFSVVAGEPGMVNITAGRCPFP
jgi:outer membrane murein-binding lipoprotein Lpp